MIPLVSGGACMLAIALVPSGAVGPFSDGFWLLLCITALSSCGGGQLAILASSFSVVADITEGRPPETIALCFGLAELWLFFGMMSGPTLAGKLADDYSVQQSFWLGVLCFTIGSTSVLVLMRHLRPLSNCTGRTIFDETLCYSSSSSMTNSARVPALIAAVTK